MHPHRVFLACLALLAAGCPESSAPTERTLDWDWTLELPPRPPDGDASLSFDVWAGGTVRELSAELTIERLGSGSITVLDAADAEVAVIRAADLDEGGHFALDPIDGDLFRLIVGVRSGEDWPTVRVDRVTVTERTTPPEEGALERGPGSTVDTVFESTDRVLFLTVPVGDEAIDIAAFGAGDVWMAPPEVPGFVLDRDIAWNHRIEIPRTGPARTLAGVIRVPAGTFPPGSELQIGWGPPDDAALEFVPDRGHARLVVREVDEGLRLSFPSPTPQEFGPFWAGVDHDLRDDPRPDCPDLYGYTDPLCEWQADVRAVLTCTDHANNSGIVVDPITGYAAPSPIPYCYDTHTGSDFGLIGGPLAQAGGVDVTAAAGGVVLALSDGHPDDCFYDPFVGEIACADVEYRRPFWEEIVPGPETPANYVVVRQDDGLLAWYYHLRQGSVRVFPGQVVACGEQLGQVGSSGNSSGPHLHYETRSSRTASVAGPGALAFRFEELSPEETEAEFEVVDPFPDRWADWSFGRTPAVTCP